MVSHMSEGNAEVKQTDEMLELIVECPPTKDGEDEPGK